MAKEDREKVIVRLAKAVREFARSTQQSNELEFKDAFAAVRNAGDFERINVIRPEDLFAASFVLHNLRCEQGKLRRIQVSEDAYLGLEVQGQHFGEETLSTIQPAPSFVRARLAHPSRIVVKMPNNLAEVPFTLDALFAALTDWPLSLAPMASGSAIQVPPPGGVIPQSRPTSSTNAAALLTAAADLDEVSKGLGRFLSKQNQRPLSQTITRRALRAARLAVSNHRDHASTVQQMRAGADAMARQLSGIRGLKPDAQAVGLALYEATLTTSLIKSALRDGTLSQIELAGLVPLATTILQPSEPLPTATAIELPYRLILSPHAGATFTHPHLPTALGNRTELWRTTLAERAPTGPQPLETHGAPLSAIWSPDYLEEPPEDDEEPPEPPFPMTIDPKHRDELVRLMSGFSERVGDGDDERQYSPEPVDARGLQLSTLGGVLEADGTWPESPNGVSVEAWSHDASYGRDQNVCVVEAGYLYPFGHRASLLTVTERTFADTPSSGRGAYLRKHLFLVVREPTKIFPASDQKYEGRKLPFQQITCLTKVSPNLTKVPASGLNEDEVFKPFDETAKAPIMFDFRALDLAGRPLVFSSPVFFVFKGFADEDLDNGGLGELKQAWTLPEVSHVNFSGQTVRMAPPQEGGDAGNVDIPLDRVVFEATQPDPRQPAQKPYFHPAIHSADVQFKAVKTLTGTAASATAMYADVYLEHGYREKFLDGHEWAPGNLWKIFLELTPPVNLRIGPDVPTDKLGGIGQPAQKLSAVSNKFGVISVPASKFYDSEISGRGSENEDDDGGMFTTDAKILGVIDLGDLFGLFAAAGAGTIPGYTTKKIYSDPDHLMPERIETSWEASTEVEPSGGDQGVLITGANGENSSDLKMTTMIISHLSYPDPNVAVPNFEEAEADQGWKDPDWETEGSFTNFKINFFGFVVVWFDELKFSCSIKNKFDAKAKLHDTDSVLFGGPLEFVNELSNLIPSDGLSSSIGGKPYIDVKAGGLEVGYDFELPSIQIGIFALKNMHTGAALMIPFDGKPVALTYYFSKREAPFLLTVSMFGGGGFFALVLDGDGVREIEAAFEFGAYAEFDVGVASGGVYVKGGVYFHVTTSSVALEGYVEIGGELSVLGFVSLSMIAHLSLGYYEENQDSYVRGQARVLLEVAVAFLSVSVEFMIERRFAGSRKSDPLFLDFIPDQDTWRRYCGAFA